MANERTKTVYTTAPACYDYGWTTEIEANVGCHRSDARKVYRRVEIQEGMAKGQCLRYNSGGYVALDCSQFAEWIDSGLVLFGDAASAARAAV